MFFLCALCEKLCDLCVEIFYHKGHKGIHKEHKFVDINY